MDPEGEPVLITLEGIDGSGKSSLLRYLGEELADLAPILTREPGATWIGDQVRRAIAEEADPVTEALLFAADHAAHIATVIRPALARGALVISDRYTDSRYAYQSVILEGILPDPALWLRMVHQGWTVPPDRTFLLVLPVDHALGRIPAGRTREHFEEEKFLERVQKEYMNLAAAEPTRFILIDAEKGSGEIGNFVARVIRQMCVSSRSRPRS